MPVSQPPKSDPTLSVNDMGAFFDDFLSSTTSVRVETLPVNIAYTWGGNYGYFHPGVLQASVRTLGTDLRIGTEPGWQPLSVAHGHLEYAIVVRGAQGSALGAVRRAYGFHNAAAGARPTDGVVVEYDFDLFGDHNYRLACYNSSTGQVTRADTGISMNSTTWRKIKIVVTDITSASVYIDDSTSAAATVSSNLPLGSSVLRAGIHLMPTNGTLFSNTDIDYFYAKSSWDLGQRNL